MEIKIGCALPTFGQVMKRVVNNLIRSRTVGESIVIGGRMGWVWGKLRNGLVGCEKGFIRGWVD
jgi:hypothetical protein